jgi:hypothetical protein
VRTNILGKIVLSFLLRVVHYAEIETGLEDVGQCVPVCMASFAKRLEICIICLRKARLLELLGFRTFSIL